MTRPRRENTGASAADGGLGPLRHRPRRGGPPRAGEQPRVHAHRPPRAGAGGRRGPPPHAQLPPLRAVRGGGCCCCCYGLGSTAALTGPAWPGAHRITHTWHTFTPSGSSPTRIGSSGSTTSARSPSSPPRKGTAAAAATERRLLMAGRCPPALSGPSSTRPSMRRGMSSWCVVCVCCVCVACA